MRSVFNLVFRLTTSHSVVKWDHTFRFGFPTHHITSAEYGDHTFGLDFQSDLIPFYRHNYGDHTFGLGFPTHLIPFFRNNYMEITLLLLVFRLTLFLSTGIIMEITLLDLVFRLTTPSSVCKWRSHFWMWFSDSPHHRITSADIIMEITLVFRLTTSCLQEYGDQPFWTWFSDSPHYIVRAKLMETTLLYLI